MKTVLPLSDWQFRQVGKTKWLSADVPGCVHTDLLAHDKIPDPFFRLNEKQVQWIEHQDWEYQTSFWADETLLQHDHLELCFEGLDTYANVYLNDRLIIEADNMFRAWRVAVKEHLRAGENHLRILFLSPIKTAEPLYDAMPYEIPANNDEGEKRVSVYTRKAQYHYGWDWGPRLVTCGIWRPVSLQAWNTATIRNVQVVQKQLTDERAELMLYVEVETPNSYNPRVEIKTDDKQLYANIANLTKGLSTLEIPVTIKYPKRWYPNGLGEAFMYDIAVSLQINGQTIAEYNENIGLRTIELVQEPDDVGISFYFKVNGHPVFMKGANFIPCDSFPSRVKHETYDQLIADAVAANMNMLRIWGGGIYEEDYFYNLCDQNGLLVWQDFMFACSMYPADEAFVNNIVQEAEYNIKRLRNHACLALWCGNNELLDAWHNWGWQETFKLDEAAQKAIWQDYEKIFYDVLPEQVAKHDPTRSYWPSSPASTYTERHKLESGDYHYWDIIKGDLPISDYLKNIGRFMSEYGFKSYPLEETLAAYAIEEDYDIRCEVMEEHQGWDRGIELVENNLAREYPAPKDFSAFLYISQLLQAQALQTAIEAYRRRMPYCMGSLYWMMNDCWPGATWSTVDYFNRWKPSHYAVREAYDKLLISPVVENQQVSIYVISDLLQDLTATLEWQLSDFNGKVLSQSKQAVNITANSSRVYEEQELDRLLDGHAPEQTLLSVALKQNGQTVATSKFYFLPVKALSLQQPHISFTVNSQGDSHQITLSSDVLAKNVRLRLKGAEAFFNDNYFDLLAKQSKTVQINTNGLQDIEDKLLVDSLWDMCQ